MFYFLPTVYDQGGKRPMGFKTTGREEPPNINNIPMVKFPEPKKFPKGDHAHQYNQLAGEIALDLVGQLGITDRRQAAEIRDAIHETLLVGASVAAVQGIVIDHDHPNEPAGFRVNIAADVTYQDLLEMREAVAGFDKNNPGHRHLHGFVDLMSELFESGFITIKKEVPEWVTGCSFDKKEQTTQQLSQPEPTPARIF